MNMYKVKIHISISEVKKELWDSLTENNIFMCYAWLKTFEETTNNPPLPYYITILEDEKIIAASVCYFDKRNNNIRSIDNILLGRLTRFKRFRNITLLPAVICGSKKGYGTHFIFSNKLGKNEINILQNKLLDTVEHIAAENKSSICFQNVMDNESDLMNKLIKRGYHKTKSLPLNYIDINWSSFDEYKKNIYRKNQRSINHEINKNRKSGVVIKQLHDIDNHQKRLIELLEMNYRKYNTDIFPLRPNYFKQVKENFGDNAIIYAAIKEESIIGVLIEFRRGKVATAPNIGIDHHSSKGDLTYFNLVFYEPIKNAFETGLQRLYSGNAFYKMKARRGYTAADTYIFYKSNNSLMNFYIKIWFLIHNLWMTRKFSYIKI